MKRIPSISLHLPLVDAVLEVTDARIPFTGRSLVVRRLIGKKPSILVLNKSDLVRSERLQEWVCWYRAQERVCAVSASKKIGIAALLDAVMAAAPGRVPKILRLMAVGIPNSGKSSLINALIGRSVARAGAKPGITRGHQWLRRPRLPGGPRDLAIEILDQPGVAPASRSGEAKWKLAAVAAIPESDYDVEECGERLLVEIARSTPDRLKEAGIDPGSILSSNAPLREASNSMGHLRPDRMPDTVRTGQWLLRGFARGELGGLILDHLPVDLDGSEHG